MEKPEHEALPPEIEVFLRGAQDPRTFRRSQQQIAATW